MKAFRTVETVFLIALFFVVSSAQYTLADKAQTIRNRDKGRWDGDSSKQLRLIEDLVIGTEEGSDEYVLGRVIDIAVDSRCNVYVADNGYSRVQKYDSAGVHQQTLGRSGEGPGEFSFLTAIAVDALDNLYVADMSRRVKIFDSDGDYFDEFRHEFPGNGIRSIKIGADGSVYLSCLDIFEQKILHKYNPQHEYLFSFCDSYAKEGDVDVRVENTFGGGTIDIGGGVIYFSQMTPYEIRKFSPSGELLSRIYRDNSFMLPPKVEVMGETMRLTMPTASASIVVLDGGMFVNIVKKPPVPQPPAETILDFFDGDGQLLLSRRFKRDMNVKYRDHAGRIYAIDNGDYPAVKRYRISFERPQELGKVTDKDLSIGSAGRPAAEGD